MQGRNLWDAWLKNKLKLEYNVCILCSCSWIDLLLFGMVFSNTDEHSYDEKNVTKIQSR